MDKKLIASHQFVTKDGLKTIESPPFHESNIPLLVVSQQDLHFVSVLPTEIMQTQDTHYSLDSQSHYLNTKNNTSQRFFNPSRPPNEELFFFKEEEPNGGNFYF